MAPLPNTPAGSHRGHLRPLDNGPQDLHAGGSTFAAYAYNLGNQPVGLYSQPQTPPGQGSLFYAAGTHGTIYYCLTGSGAGRKAFEGGSQDSGAPPEGACAPLGATPTGFGSRTDPMDFAGSDAAMTSSEYTTWYVPNREQGSVTWGEPFEFPILGGPIAYGYRPQDYDVKNVKLSTWTYCAIANGTIADWNDGAITADNGQSVTGGVSEPITFFFRSDSSGTTYLYTTDLSAQCNVTFKKRYNNPPYGGPSRSAAWTFGVSSTWPGPGSSSDPNPNFIGESGNPGVLAAIQSTPYGTGYVEGAWAKSANPKVAQALLQNGFKGNKPVFVDPTNKKAVQGALKKVNGGSIEYGMGSDEQPLGTTAPWCILYIDPSVFDTPPAKTYPLVGISYLLFYGQNNGLHVSDKQTLIKFLASSQTTKILSKLEYTSMPSSINTAILNALNGNGGSQPPCLQ
ncbi:MAG: substrate-binding domain-containing protein [Candidatus Baltobacteraceae bacterium]